MVSSGWAQWRHYIVAVGATVVMTTGVVHTAPASALGLGEIDTGSALNERFSAEIELLDTRGLQASEVIASLASADDFNRVGVERFYFLTSLKFDVQRNARGNLVIKSTSQQPITEPYLNFLVEVLWPSGRLLKEYTVLLDPPTFTHSAASPVVSPTQETSDIASAGRIDRGDVGVATTSPVRSAPVSAPGVFNGDGTYGQTTRSDTMWKIANRTLPAGNVTPQQHMLAIQRLNPTAFIDGNVNLLKAGVVLRLPSEGESSEIGSAAAIAEIDRQTEAWRSGSPSRAIASNTAIADASNSATASPIDATSRGPGVSDSAATNADGRLRIVAADATGPTSAIDSAGSGDSGVATAGDPAAQEQLEAMARQVDELTYQLDLQKRGVEQQIASREEQISLKDREIAQLQEQLRALRENVSTAQTQNPQSQDQSTSNSTPADPVADATPFWQKPAVLGTGLGALALLLAGFLFKRRRDNAADEMEIEDYAAAEPSFELGPSGTSEVVTPMTDAGLVDDLEDADRALDNASELEAETSSDIAEQAADADELSDDDLFGPSDAASEVEKEGGDAPQISDVIGEADIYIAYGRYPQAISLLEGAVDSNPADHPVRMRLIEVSAETKDAEGYAKQLGLLRQNCNDSEILASATNLHDSLDDDFSAKVESLIGSDSGSGDDDSGGLGTAGVVAGAGAALAAGAAGLFGSDDAQAQDADVDVDLSDELSADSAQSLLGDELDTDVADSFELDLDDDLADAASSDPISADNTLDDFDLDLDADNVVDADIPDLEVPSVDTDEFATNVAMDAALPEADLPDLELSETAAVADDFELDLDPEASAALAELSTDDAEAALGESLDADAGKLDIDFPDEPAELERVVAETDDDELLDEIERSLDELEADGLLTPELNDEADFSFDDDADTSATKLDLARAYIDMGDDDGAREILGEVLTEGDSNQQGEANDLLGKL